MSVRDELDHEVKLDVNGLLSLDVENEVIDVVLLKAHGEVVLLGVIQQLILVDDENVTVVEHPEADVVGVGIALDVGNEIVLLIVYESLIVAQLVIIRVGQGGAVGDILHAQLEELGEGIVLDGVDLAVDSQQIVGQGGDIEGLILLGSQLLTGGIKEGVGRGGGSVGQGGDFLLLDDEGDVVVGHDAGGSHGLGIGDLVGQLVDDLIGLGVVNGKLGLAGLGAGAVKDEQTVFLVAVGAVQKAVKHLALGDVEDLLAGKVGLVKIGKREILGNELGFGLGFGFGLDVIAVIAGGKNGNESQSQC